MSSYSCCHVAFRVVSLAFLALLGHHVAQAQTQSTVVDARFPSRLAQLVVPPLGYYDTVEEAWAAYAAEVATRNHDNVLVVVDNLRACAANAEENQLGYDYGQPFRWCNDYKLYIDGQLRASNIQNYITMHEVCPEGFEQANWSPLSGRGVGSDPYIWQRRCERKKYLHHPNSCGMGNPIYPAEGAKRQVEVDYLDPHGRLDFSRTYDSERGTFSHSLATSFLPPVNGVMSGCVAERAAVMGTYYPVCSVRIGYQTTTASFEDRNEVHFGFAWDGSIATPNEKYSNDRLASVVINSQPGWLLSRVDEGRQLLFDTQGRLGSFFLNNGGQIRLTYSTAAVDGQAPAAGFLIAAEDDLGRRLQFFYDPAGLMKKVVTPDGQAIDYSVEKLGGTSWRDQAAVGRTRSVTYPGGATKTYVWDEPTHMTGTILSNRLTGVVDENGDRYSLFKYSTGLAKSTEHAGAVDKFEMVDARVNGVGKVSVTDPAGSAYQLTYGLVDGMSRLLARSQPAGSGCDSKSSSISYDTRGNVASRVDFNGNRSCHAYASNRNLEIYRLEGLSESEVCPPDLSIAQAATDKPQRKISSQWHPLWKLETRRAEPKRIVTTVYNGQKDLVKNDDVEVICAPTAPLLPDGSKIAVVCRRYEQATNDETGNLGFDAPVTESRLWSYEYDQYGQLAKETDPRGQASGKSTTYAYWTDTSFTGAGNAARGHQVGDLKRSANALGQQTKYLEYNKRGQVLTTQFANGSQELREYHPRGWLSKLTLVPTGGGAGQVTQYDYYDTGLLKNVTQPDGSFANYTWDDAHRLKDVVDSVGNKVQYELDSAGNRTAEQFLDPANHLAKTIGRTFDALGRMNSSTEVH